MNRVQAVKDMLRDMFARAVTAPSTLCFVLLMLVSVAGGVCKAEESTSDGVIVPNSYDTCVASGGRLAADQAGRCTTANGQVFEESKKAAGATCKDLCGDGKCQEMVCMAVGCPCAESKTTCPTDCKE